MSGFTPKQIAEQKLKAFSIGNMGKITRPSRKEEEEKRRREQEALIGDVYKEFEEHFDDKPAAKINKTWVKAGTFNAGNRKEDSSGKGQLYKPTSKLAELAESFASRKKDVEAQMSRDSHTSARPERPGKKKKEEKKKSNLEIFKDELKALQEERVERHKYKAMIRAGGNPIPGKSMLDIPPGGALGSDLLADVGGDPTSTNIYLGNISPKLSERELTELFGKFGPLASVKIMYPRTEEERSRGKNCGFVAYMSRKDGERAMAALLGKNVEGHEMRMGWGKPVALPLVPIYVPPALHKFLMPPPPSGLPFNCQPDEESGDSHDYGLAAMSADNPRPCEIPNSEIDSKGKEKSRERRRFDRMLSRSVVKVVMPTDRTQLCLINRMVEFVVREGPIFEATIMNRELSNPQFRFLFENQSPEHIYYRWRLFSILQGDTKDQWNQKEFRMFKGGSLWKPPVPHIFTNGMPPDLLDSEGACISLKELQSSMDKHRDDHQSRDRERERDRDYDRDRDRDRDSKDSSRKATAQSLPGKKPLSDKQRDSLETMLRSLQPERNSIAEAMVWCIEHADSAEEIIECLAESLSILETPMLKKIARLFLISDILHNCTVKMPNVSYYRGGFQVKLPEIFSDLNASHAKIDRRPKAEAFKQRVMACFRAWEDWALYPMDFLIKMQNIFLGLVVTDDKEGEDAKDRPEEQEEEEEEEEDDDVDGVPLDGAALLKSGGMQKFKKMDQPMFKRNESQSDDSLDGEPIEFGGAAIKSAKPAGGFVTSKWETVDPEQVKAQAVTSSKWEREEAEELVKARKALMGSVASKWEDDGDSANSLDGEPMRGGPGDNGGQLDARAEEERRQILRDIEVKVMRYQDELENGEKGIKSGWSIADQVEHYRKKLLRKALDDTDSLSSSQPGSARRSTYGGTGGGESAMQSDDDSHHHRSGRSSKKRKKRNRRRSTSSSPDASRSRSRSRSERKSKRSKRSRESRSRSSSDGGGRRSRSRSRGKRSRRSRSRSRSPSRKHKKKRH